MSSGKYLYDDDYVDEDFVADVDGGADYVAGDTAVVDAADDELSTVDDAEVPDDGEVPDDSEAADDDDDVSVADDDAGIDDAETAGTNIMRPDLISAEDAPTERAPEIIRKVIIIDPEERQTTDILSRFEMSRLVSVRANQIANHNNPFVDITGLTSPIDMAKRELMQRKCPLTLTRGVGEVTSVTHEGIHVTKYEEWWDPNTMTFSQHYEV